jgi:RHS repeat-associated protein
LQQTANISSTFSEYCTGYYGFGFNGQENDEEARGNRSSYTTEFRIFDAQICRWLSVDPKAIKFTGISPYHFGYNSPLIVIDPNGDENVVTVGNQGSNIDKPNSDKKGDGSYMYGNNTRHFLERGLKEAIKLKAKDGNEKTSMIVYNTGQYSENEINAYKQRAIDAKIDFYEVKSADEMISYINDQSTQFHNNVEPGGRGGDPITDFTYVGHGSPRGFLVGYNDSDDEQFDVSSFKKKSFTDNANFTLLGCAQGLSSNDMKKHYPNSSETLFDQLLKFTNGKIEAYTVTVTWGGALGNFVPYHEGYLYPSDRNNGTFSRDFVPPSKRKVIMKGNLK